ncbi:MAG: hypothetical protein CO098_14135 [Bacteroidetes bacterium CG_4_9_14_3_um_filter_41_19]|nr:MAG: hypothetical protein CO098_14135 [Bacteroidetes bacterium CG_4_9_14_3_um_filter_41_19]
MLQFNLVISKSLRIRLMKNLIFTLLSFLTVTAFCSTTDTIRATSEIKDVTVFFSGAQISRYVDLKTTIGKQFILIDELPMEINPQSIQVKGLEHCQILSVRHQLSNNAGTEKSEKVKEVEQKIENKKNFMKSLKNQSSVFDLEEKILLENSKLGGKNDGATIEQIKEAADFYRSRLNEIKQEKLTVSTEFEKANQDLKDLYEQLNKLTLKKRTSTSQILVSIDCEQKVDSQMIVSYYIPSAGWSPLYDFRVDDITQPLTIVYNANIFQTSGEDWKNVNINLSTSNPSLSGNRPELSIMYLDRRGQSSSTQVTDDGSAIKGKITDSASGDPIPFANIVAQQEDQTIGSATSDFDGNYIIKPIPSGYYNIKVTYVGYKTKVVNTVNMPLNRIRFLDIDLESNMETLDEVEITTYAIPLIDKDNTSSGATVTAEEIQRMPSRSASSVATKVGGVFNFDDDNRVRGSRNASNDYYFDGVGVNNPIETTDFISNTLRTRVTHLQYHIDIPYSIPSDGKDYTLKIKEAKVPVEYIYYAIPKLETDVFLTAAITDWNQLDLLSGKTSIYYQGTFTGESVINSDDTSDTLTVSLGRDNQIVVNRDGNKELIDKRFMGNDIKETVGWDITVKNNKNVNIKLVVEDQFPISEKKSIEVELLEFSQAKVENKTGKLTWELSLESNEKKIMSYVYRVKYPKYVNLMLD